MNVKRFCMLHYSTSLRTLSISQSHDKAEMIEIIGLLLHSLLAGKLLRPKPF